MMKVAEIRELESYVEEAQEANWKMAMEEEMHALAENEKWDLVEPPKGIKLIDCKWVFKMKQNDDGSINRYKAMTGEEGLQADT